MSNNIAIALPHCQDDPFHHILCCSFQFPIPLTQQMQMSRSLLYFFHSQLETSQVEDSLKENLYLCRFPLRHLL